jgi:hypothetical protein
MRIKKGRLRIEKMKMREGRADLYKDEHEKVCGSGKCRWGLARGGKIYRSIKSRKSWFISEAKRTRTPANQQDSQSSSRSRGTENQNTSKPTRFTVII